MRMKTETMKMANGGTVDKMKKLKSFLQPMSKGRGK